MHLDINFLIIVWPTLIPANKNWLGLCWWRWRDSYRQTTRLTSLGISKLNLTFHLQHTINFQIIVWPTSILANSAYQKTDRVSADEDREIHPFG